MGSSTPTAGAGGRSAPHGDRGLRGEAYEDLVGTVYEAAVRLGRPTREGLRREGLHDPEIDHAMPELVARGLVQGTGNPDRWTVPPPRQAIARHAETVERRLAVNRATAGQLEAMWRRALADRLDVNDNPDIDLLVGLDEIVTRASGMHRVATTRLWWAMDASRATWALLEQAVDRPELLRIHPGVDVRLIFDAALLDRPAAMAHLERSQDAGHPVRVANGIPVTVLVCDDRAGLLDLSSHDPQGEGSLEARRPGPIGAMERFVTQVWRLAVPFGPDTEDAAGEPGGRSRPVGRDQRILTLLTSGASDQFIARQLEVSVRTVERRVRYLMEHLGAATRFQAGVQAVRRGWV